MYLNIFLRAHYLINIFVILTFTGLANSAILPPDNTGNFYVSSYNSDEIVIYDSSGKYLRSFTASGLNGPRGIVINPNNGMIYVASQLSDEIFIFDSSEEHIGSLSNAQLSGPTGMALSDDGLLYVAGYNSDAVVVFDSEGTMLRSFTGGDMNGPNCIAFDSDGYIYVSSALTNTVIKFDQNEEFMISFTSGDSSGMMETTDGDLSSPMGIARSTDDVLFVTGGGSNNIVKFDTDGTYLGEITHSDLTGPQGIAFDDRGHMFSSSYYQDQIVEFDASGSYVQTIAEGDLQIPRSIAFVSESNGATNNIVPTIKANGSTGFVNVCSTDMLTISISLDNDNATSDADWFMVYSTDQSYFSYNALTGVWTSGISTAYEGALFNLSSYDIVQFSANDLDSGTYTFYFGVDTTMNGQLDGQTGNGLYYDYVTVNIANDSSTCQNDVRKSISQQK